ncbi:TetR/AcrR family transcriptional regulator [Rhizobium sp. Root1220]|uniref:TetR/AcrR family transcriptional regulator n=1 Tax=Rhizobium sp. Root1220 TaxID=1736432 RepID=UPI0007016E1F|nr:TetR/AcrR family transcriptional regulator [Rhizobium sp. Root1220]KQV66263.1 TetR family transcriptional regulator [Rhizobium sp. Root1220]
MTELSHTDTDESPSTGGRWAAGEDPAKRKQILDGARRVFMKLGFDAASMNDVTRDAGVSKGTLYVYFANKEELFTAMIESERAAFVASMRTALAEHGDIESGLHDFGTSFVMHLTDEKVISAMRTVLGVRDRMPALCQRFFNGPENLRTILCDYLARYVEAGRLEISDIDLAAGQFLDLCSGGFFKFRLFGSMEHAPPRHEIERVINGAIRVFMAAYGANPRR